MADLGDHDGKDLVVGSVFVALERCKLRILEVAERNYFPPPMGVEVVLRAYEVTYLSFRDAQEAWERRGRSLQLALSNLRVREESLKERKYRVIARARGR